jgi:hypothetical protein
MPQIFPRSANQIAKASIVVAILGAASAGTLLFALDRSPYHTGQNLHVPQEVPFSHDHHTAGLGIDCRYCHTSVEESRFAGIPPTATCMNCHKVIWANTEMLKPVRDSWASGEPLRWNRVNDLPDYVYFNHSVHLKKGVGCETCHGPVNEMPLMRQQHSLQMGWCLECHDNPEKFLRPREEIFNFDWDPADVGMTQAQLGAQLADEYHVNTQVHCYICHR